MFIKSNWTWNFPGNLCSWKCCSSLLFEQVFQRRWTRAKTQWNFLSFAICNFSWPGRMVVCSFCFCFFVFFCNIMTFFSYFCVLGKVSFKLKKFQESLQFFSKSLSLLKKANADPHPLYCLASARMKLAMDPTFHQVFHSSSFLHIFAFTIFPFRLNFFL